MKVVIVGGYGVFGSLIAKMLVRDGHAVWLAGRRPEQACSLAKTLGAWCVETNVDTSPAAIFGPKPDLVIDAAGPFQDYGRNRYRLPKLCISQKCHYLDLSDSPEFTKGIAQLDDAARRAGVFLLSGASSVPALSSIVATELSKGLDVVNLIDTAILPGNRAPRGRAVIESITGGVGRRVRIKRGGIWRSTAGWTDKKTYDLSPRLKRTAYTVNVPDLTLLPDWIAAESVTFRAGLELRSMNAALSLLARVRRRWDVDLPRSVVSLLHLLSKALYPFGSDRGGMQVSVIGSHLGAPVRRSWTLIAENGDGPFVPGVMCRAIARAHNKIKFGARPCLAELPRQAIEEAMSDLAITTCTTSQDHPTLFQTALHDRWDALPRQVRKFHSVQDVNSFRGKAIVTRGRSLIARGAAWFFGFPKANESADVTVTKTRLGNAEVWERNFDGKVFRSNCSAASTPYRYRERFGCFTFEQDLPVRDDALHLPVRRGWFLGVPLPRVLLPTSDSREYVENGKFRFDVSLGAPLGGGLIVRYRGHLVPDDQIKAEVMEAKSVKAQARQNEQTISKNASVSKTCL